MSGKFLARASALSLAFMLAACGGDSDSTDLAPIGSDNPPAAEENDPDTGGDGSQGSDTTTPDSSSNYALGTGSATSFSPGEISASISTLTVGSEKASEATLTLNIVDTSNGDALAKISKNDVTFSSQCSITGKDEPAASFSPPTVPGLEGKVSTTYAPTVQCVEDNDGKDIITARLNGSDEITATVEVALLDQAAAPSIALGSGDGTAFVGQEIGKDRDTLVVGATPKNSVGLSLSLVDPSDENKLITGSGESISFTSVCQASGLAEVTPASIDASEGKVLASYSATAGCLDSNGGEDTITARLSGNPGVEATATISLAGDETAIGFFNGSSFNPGQIQFPGSAIAGKSTPISVSIVDLSTPKPHPLIKSSQNSVSYESTCSLAGRASFSPESPSGAQGTAPSTYTPTEECVSYNKGKDTITARLNGSDVIVAEVDVTVVPGAANGASIAFGAFTATPGDPTPSFKNGVVAAPEQVLAGTSAPVAVSIVDPDSGFALVKNTDTNVTFTSQCSVSGNATFSPSDVPGSEGKAISTYTPSESCLDGNNGNDIIRATLKAGELTLTAEVAVSIQSQTSAPEVALDDIIATPTALTIGESATISTKIVDPVTGDLVKQSGNSVTFSSLCVIGGEASFSQQTVSGRDGLVYTNYTPTQSCLQSTVGQDTITARLNGSDDIQKSVIITLNAQPPAISPALGYIDGDGNFVSGQIEVSPSKDLTIGDETLGQASVTLTVVDPANPGSPLVGLENKVTFFSACISADWASMDNQTVATEAGKIRATYTPGAQCIGDDTLYAKLNDDSEKLADVTFTNTPKVVPPEPVIEVGSLNSSGNFVAGLIRVIEPALTLSPTGEASTDMIVNIQKDGAIASGDGYTATFTSMCIDSGRASVTGTQTTQSGAILATYNASPNCLGTDNVVVFLGTDSSLKASADVIVTDTKLAIGSYDDAGLFVGNLASSKPTLDYNAEDEPSSDIRSVIAKVDDSGNFIDQVVGFESGVEFFSTCIDSGLASVVTSGATESGELISTYKAQGCVGEDTVYGRIAGTNEVAFTSIEILPKTEQKLLLGRIDGNTFTDGEIGKSRITDLPVGAQTRLYLSIVDSTDESTPLVGQPLSVQLSSTCEGVNGSESPLAAANLSLSTGYAEVLYTAQTCGLLKKDTVSATLTGAKGLTATAKTTITLDKDPVAHSLTASQPEPNSIAPGELDGTYEGRTSTSFVQFQLKNKQGTGTNLANRTISFRLDDPAVEGITLEPGEAQTDEEGYVTVTVKAENDAPNSVFRVIATYESLETYSAPIAVNSKLPFQGNFSLSTTNIAPDTWGKDGVTVELSLRAADSEGNRLRGNTVVNFTTDEGTINPDCVLDNEGRCIVTWESLGTTTKFAEITAYTHGLLADGSTTGEITSSTRMLMSRSEGLEVELIPAQTPYRGEEVCARAWTTSPADGTEIMPPTGTTLEFAVEPENGAFIPESSNSQTVSVSGNNIEDSGFLGCTFFEPESPFLESMNMTVVATTPEQAGFNNNTANARLAIEPPPAP